MRLAQLRFRRTLICIQIALLIAIVPSLSFAASEDAHPAAIGFDIAVLRTLGAIRLVVGAVALIPASIFYTLKMPIDGDAGALKEATEVLVVEPANYLFRRPLGEDFSGD